MLRRISKFLVICLVISMVLPGIGQAVSVSKEKGEVVKRLSGLGRVETAVEASKEIYKEGASAVVLAGYNGDVDALAGTLLANTKDAPLLLTRKAALSDATRSEIERLNAKTVYIIGGEAVVSAEVAKELKELDYIVVRVEGSNRYLTAVETAKKVKDEIGNHVFLALGKEVVKGDALADALAIGPVSAMKKSPVLLTKTDKLPVETLEVMQELNITHVTIVGGTAAVSAKVENILKEDYTVDRVEGDNREKTALAIANRYFGNATSSIIAYGRKSADALVGGYLGAKINAPILLTSKDKLSTSIEGFISKDTIKAYVLGGINVISDSVFKRVEEIIIGEDAENPGEPEEPVIPDPGPDPVDKTKVVVTTEIELEKALGNEIVTEITNLGIVSSYCKVCLKIT